MLFQHGQEPSARDVAHKQMYGSDDVEWVISPKASLTARSGFLTGPMAEAAWKPQALEKKLMRERMQGTRSARRGQSNQTERSTGSGDAEDNQGQKNSSRYQYMGCCDLEQELSEKAKAEKARLAAKHKRRSQHEARIMARVMAEEEAKGKREQARIVAKSQQLASHVQAAHQQQGLNDVIINGKRRANESGRVRNFAISNGNTALEKEVTSRSGRTGRTGLATARFLTGGAVGGGTSSHQQRNGSSVVFDDFNRQ